MSSSSSSSSSGDERCPSPDKSCTCKECCPACDFDESDETVRYFNGEFRYSVADLSSGGQGLAWGHTRYYSNQRYRGTTPVNEDIGQGTNWFVDNWPYITDQTEDGSVVVVSFSQEQSVFFNKSGSTYTPTNGAENRYSLVADPGDHRFRMTDPRGIVWEFQDFTSPSGPPGRFYRATGAGGQQIVVTSYSDDSLGEVERTYTQDSITYTEKYTYAYTSGQLASVTLQRKEGGGSFVNVERVNYTYYGSSDGNGNLGDLKTAVAQRWDGSIWENHGTHYYRYYTGSAGGTGFKHGLQYVVGPEAYSRMVVAGLNPLTASATVLNNYADYRLQYNSDQRVTFEAVAGGARVYTFAYTQRSGTSSDLNQWQRKTVMSRPDGGQVTVFVNGIGQAILHELLDQYNELSWRHYFEYDSAAHVTLHAHPSAVQSWSLASDSSPLSVTLRASDGFIELTDYPTSTTATETVAGNVLGYEKAQKIKKGSGGTPITLREMAYFQRTVGSASVVVPAQETVYRDESSAQPVQTSYSYSWFTGLLAYEQRTTTLPAVSAAQQGSGSSNTRTERFSPIGELLWLRDEAGFITGNSYDPGTGGLTQSIVDVSDALVSVPEGWMTPPGGGLHLVTDYMLDELGRVTMVKGPVHEIDLGGVSTSIRSITTTLYLDSEDEVRTAQGYATGTNYDNYTLYNPISITKSDEAGRPVEQIQATRGSGVTTAGDLSPSDTFARSSYVRWSTSFYNTYNQLTRTRVYHDIPASGAGTKDTNYSETVYYYDTMGRQAAVGTPGGTGTQTFFDVRNLPTTVRVGVLAPIIPTPGRSWQNQTNPYDVNNDGEVTAADAQAVIDYINQHGSGTLPEPPVSPPPPPPYVDIDGDGDVEPLDALIVINYLSNGAIGGALEVTTYEYDGGQDGGDGNLTTETQLVDATSGNNRVTTYSYDWRNRRTAIDGEEGMYVEYQHDNLDRVTVTLRRDGSSSGTLLGKQETLYDDLGRVYQSKRYAVNPSTGAIGNALVDRTWYDARGNVAKQQSAGSQAFTKTFYDGAGRSIQTLLGYDLAETTYSGALTTAGDTIFEQTETTYDAAGNVLQTVSRRRYHDTTGTGELLTACNPQGQARLNYQMQWSDGIGRTVAMANYGTQGVVRPATVPARSDTVLVTTTEFNAKGEAYKTIDPAGTESRVELDAAGRQVKTIQNYVDGDPTTGGPDEDVTVEYTYNADGRVHTLTARQQNPADDQTTTYEYGVTTGGGSAINSNDLLARVIYPDSADSSDNVEYQYNRQGQVIRMRDQNGTVHEYDYDQLGRQTQDRVTTLASGVDGAVRRIGTSYEKRGLVEKITSYDDAVVGSGNVVNEVQNAYNDFSQLTAQYQAHGGAVNTSTSPNVQYAYADGSANHVRPVSVTYPGGRIVRYEYDSGDDDALSRISYLADDASGSVGTHLAEYSYLGLGMVVKVDYPEPELAMDLAAGSGLDPYTGLDRFDRVVDLRWTSASSDAVRIKHGYDRAGSRLWREDVVAKSQITPVYLDEYYTYDGMYQLTAFDRGELNSGHTGISGTPSREEDWTLDALGNWDGYVQKAAGTTSLDQARTVNEANEITGISETVGPAWPTPGYDRNGNSTSFPQPLALTTGYDATYDAWNRLVKLEDGASTVQENEYDGQNWRTVTRLYSGGSLSQTRHQYYSSGWQLLEERVGSATTPERQFVWGTRYIDDLVLRERDTDASGSVNERLYSMQDPNWNVVAVSDASGAVQERYSYTPYGVVTKLSPTFGASSATIQWNEILYAGYRYESDTGLYYVRNRYYHPELGRWVSRDPLRQALIGSLYSYAGARPAQFIDPSGLAFLCYGLAGGFTGLAPLIVGPNGMPFGLGVSYSCGVYACLGKQSPTGWYCGVCLSCGVTLMAGAGAYISASFGPSVIFNAVGNKPSEGGGVSTGVGGGVQIPDAIPFAGEITVDVDLMSGDTTISFPKIGPGLGFYLAVRFSGTCTGCNPGGLRKVLACIDRAMMSLRKALTSIAAKPYSPSDKPVTVKLEGAGERGPVLKLPNAS